MLKTLRLALLILCALGLTVARLSAADGVTRSEDLALSEGDPKEVLVLLKSIAGTIDVSVVDQHTIRVRDTPNHLAVAEQVVKMFASVEESRYTAGDGSVILNVFLQHATAKDVMFALRAKLHVPKIAIIGTNRVLLRDTASQADAALGMIRDMEHAG